MALRDPKTQRFTKMALADRTDVGNPICVRFDRAADAKLRAMADRSAFIREAVLQALAQLEADQAD